MVSIHSIFKVNDNFEFPGNYSSGEEDIFWNSSRKALEVD
jgi:hypothetical protein